MGIWCHVQMVSGSWSWVHSPNKLKNIICAKLKEQNFKNPKQRSLQSCHSTFPLNIWVGTSRCSPCRSTQNPEVYLKTPQDLLITEAPSPKRHGTASPWQQKQTQRIPISCKVKKFKLQNLNLLRVFLQWLKDTLLFITVLYIANILWNTLTKLLVPLWCK